MENISILQSSITELKDALKKGDMNYNVIFYVLIIIASFIWEPGILLLIWYIIIMGIIKTILLRCLSKIEYLNTELFRSRNSIDGFSMIEEKFTIVYNIIKVTIIYNKVLQGSVIKIWKHIQINTGDLFQDFFYKECSFIYTILKDLHSDLSIRLAKQQKVLESAKWEVEKNIKWTTDLNQVSELQKARLDKQIEQFEELQRVLVKV